MPAPDPTFSISTDPPPEIEDLPDDYSVLLNETIAKTWEFTVSDVGAADQIDPLVELQTGAA